MRLFTGAMLAFGLCVCGSQRIEAQQPNTGNKQSGQQGQEQGPQFAADQFIKDHDTNNDGKLSREELPKDLQEGFAQIDADKSGTLSQEELQQHAARMASRRPQVVEVLFWAIDVPDRQPLNAQELQAAYEMLRKVDKDNDGKITEEELQACRMERRKERISSVTQRLDKNNDQKISKEEARGIWKENFAQLDANNDGSIDASELETALTPKPAEGERGTGTDKP